MNGAIDRLQSRFDRAAKPAVDRPEHKTFKEFLTGSARVRTGSGYVPYGFEGRQVIAFIVDAIDVILGLRSEPLAFEGPNGEPMLLDNGGKPMTDARLDTCGGAQWGKTVLALNYIAFMTGCRFRNIGYYLPDDDLVQGIVDTKFRPDVIDQIAWFADSIQVGKAVNRSGRAVNRKGAFMVTDGTRSAQGYIRGMGKIPTSFSMDTLVEDEKDDIPDVSAKFLKGRMTSSDLRFAMSIGTQRYHGSGQNKQFEDGCQWVVIHRCPDCGRAHCTEEEWPGIARMDLGAGRDNPRLTQEGVFKTGPDDPRPARFDHEGRYYFACVDCGAEIDRHRIAVRCRNPEALASRTFSIRVSQMGTAAISVKQIVADWCLNAVKDPDAMKAFSCDRRAIPKSTLQSIDRDVLDRARSLEPYNLSLAEPEAPLFAGLDTGDRCWLTVREVFGKLRKRVKWAEEMSSERTRERVKHLVDALGIGCLFVDAGPLRDLARDLAFDLNGIREQNLTVGDANASVIHFGGGLVWDGPKRQWRGLKCAAVEFTQAEGAGVKHKLGVTPDGLLYPIIAANRNETIAAVLQELLTPEEGVLEVIDDEARTEPSFRLPERSAGSPPILDTLDRHILTGAKQEPSKNGRTLDYVDGCENHLLLSLAYARLAETISEAAPRRRVVGTFKRVATRASAALRLRRTRSVMG